MINYIMKRRSAYVSMVSDDDDDSDIDHITSYCEKCNSFGFLSELGPRVYPKGEGGSIPHDSDNWLQCYRCGQIISKVNAQRLNEIAGIIESPDADDNPHDSSRVTIKPIHSRPKSYDRKKEAIKRIDSVGNSGAENDKDLQNMLSNGNKQLISYNDSD